MHNINVKPLLKIYYSKFDHVLSFIKNPRVPFINEHPILIQMKCLQSLILLNFIDSVSRCFLNSLSNLFNLMSIKNKFK